ncbi:MAG: hypothetical protein KDA81_15625 [Planctomycetaceae bacterium]|nr:hypothetical protein [Planctomycetaceae bacterium]
MRISGVLLFLLIIAQATSASDFQDLVQNVPRGANGIMVIDVAKAVGTPIAKKNGWSSKGPESSDRPLYLPPEADKVLAVAKFDIVRNFQQAWNVTAFGMTESIPLRLVARAEGGYVDNIDGTDAVWIPSDAYLLQSGETDLVMQAPADRQAVARWIDQHRKTSLSEISDYLSVAIASIKREPQIVLALDAGDSIQRHRVRQHIQQSELAEKHNLDPEQLTDLITGLRGVVVEIVLTDGITAKARIDFSDKVTLNAGVAKELVLAALSTREMSLPGIESWRCSVVDKSILMDGNLSADSLRRLISLMEPPSTKFSSLKEANVETASGDETAKYSLQYYQAIQSLLKDLRQKSGSHANDAYWIDRYAKKIDQLPILHVDNDLLDYGQKLSETLRVMSGSRRMTNLQGGAAARHDAAGGGSSYDSGYGYGYYNYPSLKDRQTAVAVDRADAAASGTAVKLQGWNLIDNATNDIRREMTSRYKIEF